MKHFSYAISGGKVNILFTVGPITSPVLDLGKFLLDPNGGRLVFVPKVLDDETLGLIAKLSNGISKKLEHTPIIAAGCNFVYRLESGEDFAIEEIQTSVASQAVYSDIGLKPCFERSVLHAFALDDHILNVTFSSNESNKILMLNYDYRSPIDAVDSASKALLQNHRHSLTLRDKLIKRKTGS
jgi:hypothetical protein